MIGKGSVRADHFVDIESRSAQGDGGYFENLPVEPLAALGPKLRPGVRSLAVAQDRAEAESRQPLVGSEVAVRLVAALEAGGVERFVNLVEEGIELALRIGNLEASTLVARRLGTPLERVQQAIRRSLKSILL